MTSAAVDMGWFVVMASLTAMAWGVGCVAARRCPSRCWMVLVVGVALLGSWAWLSRHPAVAVRLLPVEVLSHVEGIGAVPAFMLVVGVIWGRRGGGRERRVAMWATLLGAVYFLQGGIWMIQTTPRHGFAETVQRGPVRQSQEFSCVPAACATTLNMLGIYTSEAEMARLTRTRPGFGATPVRALQGLNRRLESTPYRFHLITARAEDLGQLPLPALTPLQFEATRRHMVTIRAVSRWGVWIEDPIEGLLILDWSRFKEAFGGTLLVYTGPPPLPAPWSPGGGAADSPLIAATP